MFGRHDIMLDWCMIGMCGRNFFLQRASVARNTHDCLPHTMEQIETEIHTRNPLRLTKHFETMWRLPTLFLLTKSLFFLANTTLSATVSRPLLRGAGPQSIS